MSTPFQYSKVVNSEPLVPGFGPARILSSLDKPVVLPAGVTNLHENLLRGVKESGDQPFLGYRKRNGTEVGEYVWETYNQTLERIINFGAGLKKLGLELNANVSLFSINRPEWVITEHACYVQGLVSVPLYDTLGPDTIEYIINFTETSVVVCTADKVKKILDIASKLPTVKTIVVMDGDVSSFKPSADAANIKIHAFKEIEDLGKANPVPKAEINTETVATLCFTSGTTGVPKGVILSHGNILSFVAGAEYLVSTNQTYPFSKTDVHLSYLPLAHIFERIIQATISHYGGRIGFYQGDTLKLLSDSEVLKPTIFASVPRLFNKIYDRVNAGVKEKGGIAAFLFNTAYKSKASQVKYGETKHWLWDSIVFKNVKAKLGGNVRCMFTGSAPISKEVIEFLKVAFCCPVLEGYGQTENTASATITLSTDPSSGHIGVPAPQCMIKLRDVPSMGYTSEDKPFPRGEICVKGACVFKGYYKSEEKTKETLGDDGWLYSGDIGQWDEHGRLKIVDRVKNIFKLAQGEYIAPDKIEVVYGTLDLVAQVFVYGDSLQSTLVAIVVPEESALKSYAAQHGITGDFKTLCSNKDLALKVAKELEKHGRANGLAGFENVKRIHFEPEPFTPDNLLSPSFKFKRHEGKKHYQAIIDALYADMGDQK